MNQGASNVFDEPDKLADFAAAVSSSEVQELQDVLESVTVEDHLQKALLVLKKELINSFNPNSLETLTPKLPNNNGSTILWNSLKA